MIKVSHIALVSAILVAGATVAEAGWKRSGGGVGPRGGTFSSSGSGSCAGGACASTGSYTGPAGNTVVRNSSGSCSGGVCTRNGTLTGPNGNSAVRSGSISRN